MKWRVLVALTLATVTAGCGAAQRLASSPVEPDWLNQVQPFVNRPAPAYTRPTLGPAPYPTPAPLCRASQLRAVQGRGGVGLGNILLRVDFINVGQVPCQLSGTPRVEGADPTGRMVVLPVTSNGTYFVDPIPADIAPGESGYLNIGMTNEGNCPGAPPAAEYTNLRFGLPGGGWIATNLTAYKACGLLAISGLGKEPGPVVEPSPSPGSIGTLRVTVQDFSRQARAGGSVRFIVLLANVSDVAVSLSPCPSFTELVNVEGKLAVRSVYLNCDHVAVIPSNQTVRYAMEMDVPEDSAHLPVAKWYWGLNTPFFGAGAGGVLEITA